MPATDLLSETKACELLARLFRARGYDVKRNVPFREYGVSFHIDGWDPQKRVGFEFLTSEDEDHDDLTLGEYQTLMGAQQRGELALFIVDEVEPVSVADLTAAATDFLDEVAAAAAARRTGRRPMRKAAKKSRPKAAGTPAKKRVAKKVAAKKPARKPQGATKAAARKPGKQPAKKQAAARKPRRGR